jgi:hypothetical protein
MHTKLSGNRGGIGIHRNASLTSTNKERLPGNQINMPE